MSRIARLTLIGFTLALAACNTVSGVGAGARSQRMASPETTTDPLAVTVRVSVSSRATGSSSWG